MRGGDGEEVGSTKACARKNNRVHSMNADWPGEGDWTRPLQECL